MTPAGDVASKICIQECRTCARCWRTDFPGCPYCGGSALRHRDVPGRGTVYSWVEVHRSLEDPPAHVPYTVVAVDLDAGARVFGRYAPGGDPAVGERVVMASGEGHEDGEFWFGRDTEFRK